MGEPAPVVLSWGEGCRAAALCRHPTRQRRMASPLGARRKGKERLPHGHRCSILQLAAPCSCKMLLPAVCCHLLLPAACFSLLLQAFVLSCLLFVFILLAYVATFLFYVCLFCLFTYSCCGFLFLPCILAGFISFPFVLHICLTLTSGVGQTILH